MGVTHSVNHETSFKVAFFPGTLGRCGWSWRSGGSWTGRTIRVSMILERGVIRMRAAMVKYGEVMVERERKSRAQVKTVEISSSLTSELIIKKFVGP